MDITEYRERRKRLAADIEALIDEFERETESTVTAISLERIDTTDSAGPSSLIQCAIATEL